MFSNLSSYLFGSYQNAENETKNSINFHEVEDDEWMLISKIDNGSTGDDLIEFESEILPEKSKDRSRQRSSSCKEMNRRFSSPLRELSPSIMNCNIENLYASPKLRTNSRSSSKSSSQCFMEESWYVTPPPCFISEPYDTKPSSLENLLIEQPGVNYLPHRGIQTIQEISSYEAGSEKKQPQVEKPRLCKPNQTKTKKSASVQPVKDDRRQQILQIHEDKKFLTICQSQLNIVQKMEQTKPTQFLKKNQMERLNKVQYELSSSNKRQRRSDMNKKHSGANNNRKCCY